MEIQIYVYANWINLGEDGEHSVGPNNMKESTELKRKIFEAGVVDKDFLTDKDGRNLSRISQMVKLGFMRSWL